MHACMHAGWTRTGAMRRTGANVATAFRLWSPITTSMPRLKTSENARRAPSPPMFSSIGKCSKLQGSTPLMDGLYTRLAQTCASGVRSHHIPHVRGPPIIGREKGERECRGGGDREREKGKGGGRECAEGGARAWSWRCASRRRYTHVRGEKQSHGYTQHIRHKPGVGSLSHPEERCAGLLQ